MEARPVQSALLLGLMIGLGTALGGYFVGRGFYSARTERYVTVKGLAQRDVIADLGVWTISYSSSGADLNQAGGAANHDRAIVSQFAQTHGFTTDEFEFQPSTVTDTFTNQGDQRERPNPNQRFIIKGSVRIRSSKVDKIRAASQDTAVLVNQGVVLGENYPQAPVYFFTKLNDIRPAMLADATRSARSVADQFAADSHSQLGQIRRANQGVFEIRARDSSGDGEQRGDEGSSIEKQVRLVSTVDYYLLD